MRHDACRRGEQARRRSRTCCLTRPCSGARSHRLTCFECRSRPLIGSLDRLRNECYFRKEERKMPKKISGIVLDNNRRPVGKVKVSLKGKVVAQSGKDGATTFPFREPFTLPTGRRLLS